MILGTWRQSPEDLGPDDHQTWRLLTDWKQNQTFGNQLTFLGVKISLLFSSYRVLIKGVGGCSYSVFTFYYDDFPRHTESNILTHVFNV